MQAVDNFPQDLTVTYPTARVLVNGTAVDFETVSVQSELESAMPAQVATGGGAVVAATGEVSVLPSSDVSLTTGNPWGDGVPSQGSSVSVFAGYGGAEAVQFTGVTDGTSGAPKDASVSVSLIDGVDRLDRPITIAPMLNSWPSLTEGDYTLRRAGLSPLYFTDRILRHCGFYATPRLSGVPVMSAPMMGSSWPERGTLEKASAVSDPLLSTAWAATHWGVGLANGTASYRPDYGSRTGRLDGEFQMTFVRSLMPTNTGVSATFTVFWGAAGLKIQSSSGGHVYARHISASGTETTVATMTSGNASGADTFTVRWLPGGNVTIYASNGSNVTATVPYPTPITDTAMTRVEVVSPPGSMPWGGLQASFATDPAWSFERTAHLTPPAFIYGLTAFPALIDRNCSELLKEQAEAELAAMWIDERGHFRWVNRDKLTGSVPAGVLTSEDNLLDLPWEMPSKSVYSRVEVEASTPTVTRRPYPNLNLQMGTGSTLDNADDDSQFIEPPADESWYMVSTPRRAASDAVAVRRGRGSFIGGLVVQEGAADRWATTTELSQTWDVLGPQKWLLKSVASIAGSQQVDMKVLEHESYGKYGGSDLYQIRGRARARWESSRYVGSSAGPSGAPVLSHSAGPWIQDPIELQELADWLAEQVTVSSPIVRDVPIVPDPRIQKGDVFWVEDNSAYKIRLKVLVMGISLTLNAGPPLSMEQSITCRVISAERSAVTLREHDEVWAGETLGQHDLFWAGKTLEQHDAAPLAH